MNTEQRLEKYRADLLWAASSPDLMMRAIDGPASINESPAHTEFVGWLENNIQHLDLSSLGEKPAKRLGLYFEKLWHFLLDAYPRFELAAHNVPVLNDKRTVGEFDFIYFCKRRQRYIHMETAIKFYLGFPSENTSTAEWHNWIGPGRKDRLDIKFSHMLNHQCQLSLMPEGKSLLSNMGVHTVDREICLKGYFFYPLGQTVNAPKYANSKHLSGFWCKLKDIMQELGKLKNKRWATLPKASWFSTQPYSNNPPSMDLDMLTEFLSAQFKTNPFPRMISNADIHGEANNTKTNIIQERGFIVPDDWPY